MSVTKIGAQRGDVPLDRPPVSCTLFKRPDCKCVSEVVNAAAAEPRATAQAG